jgi:cytidylate kinase
LAYLLTKTDTLGNLSISELKESAKNIPDMKLRSDVIGAKASEIAKIPEIRETMTKFQRELANNPGEGYAGSVLDGRDIGTVVAPDAICKIFVTADLGIRAKRRFEALKLTDSLLTYDEVYKKLKARDQQDQSREIAPLKCDDSYVMLDTSNDTIEESLKKMREIVQSVLARGSKK